MARKRGWLGINKDTYTRTTNTGNYKWRYDVEYIGEKAHGNSVIAAIGLVQLKYLDRDNAYRRQVAKWYRDFFEKWTEKVRLVNIPKGCESSMHLFQIFVENRDEVMLRLNADGIYPGVHYTDNTKYRMYQYDKGKCPRAAYASEHILSLPMHLDLTYEDIRFIAETVISYADILHNMAEILL